LNPQDPFGYMSAGMAAISLRWWDDAATMRARLTKQFPRLTQDARTDEAITLRWRGKVEEGNKIFEDFHLVMPDGFVPLFYISFWRRDYEECRKVVAQAAKYPELEADRWDKELQLHFVTKFPFDEEAARAAEKRLEERLAGPIGREQEGQLIIVLSNVKMLLGKNEEAVRIAEQSVRQHPISEDALANAGRLSRLGLMYVYAGEHERAMQTFVKLVQIPMADGHGQYGPLKYNPILDGLRQDPRFDEILKQSQQPFPRL
ncbi:MAG: hypothetical protein M3505_08995, partial [Verrucomicrobiota bacterium]|nr:hypothetical protein [Verrucomicrobiota bacterium]